MATEKLKYIVTADTKGFSGPIKAIGALAVTAFVAAVKVTAEFEQQLSKLRAVSGATEAEMVQLERKARDLGKSTAFTAKEVASLQFELAKLGFTTNDILNASGGVLDLAAGLGVELADAAKLSGITLRQFGLEATETGRVVDVLAKSASNSALDFSKLLESLKFAGPVARDFNFTLEETVAMLSVLANAGISGSQAGTALRRIFTELNKKGITLSEAFDMVNKSTDRAGTAFKLVGRIGQTALSVLSRGVDDIDEFTNSLNASEGAADKMRRTMEDNLIGDFDKLKSAVTETGLAIGSVAEGSFRTMVQEITFMVTSLNNAIKAFKEFKANIPSLPSWLAPGRGLQQRHNALFGPNGTALRPPGGGSGGGAGSGSGGGTNRGGGNTVGAGSGNASLFGDGLDFLEDDAKELEAFAESLDNVRLAADQAFGDAWWTNTVNAFDKNLDKIKTKGTEVTKSLEIGWKQVGLAVASAIGSAVSSGGGFADIGKALLGALGGLLIAIGTAALLANTALKVFGIEISTGAAIAAIAFGTTLNALNAGGGSPSSSGGSASSPGSSVSPLATPTATQGFGGGAGLVATVRGQDLRFLLQGANDSYNARN